MKWFFALNSTSLLQARDLWEPMILGALSSARNLDVQPHLIFDGETCPFLETLAEKGVQIIKHRVSFFDALARFAETRPSYLSTASGAFLRVELPILEIAEEFVIYTDCDILFTGQKLSLDNVLPSYFACAPEFNIEDYSNFNTGVMVMNLPSMRESLPGFVDFIKNNLERFQTYDQDAYRLFYRDKVQRLPPILNWKPYWGVSSEAEIVHFHGPKPPWVRRTFSHPAETPDPVLTTIMNWNIRGYQHYLPLWEFASSSS